MEQVGVFDSNFYFGLCGGGWSVFLYFFLFFFGESEVCEFELSALEYAGEDGPADFVQDGQVFVDVGEHFEGEVDDEALCLS